MQKSGQIALFFIIGIISVALIILAFYYRSSLTAGAAPSFPPEIEKIRLHVSGCFEEAAKQNLLFLGIRGGYYNLPQDYLQTYFADIPYAYFNAKNTFITMEELEAQFAAAVKDGINECIDLSQFSRLSVSQPQPQLNIDITDANVQAVLRYDLAATAGSSSYKVTDPYLYNMPVSLGRMYKVANTIASQTARDNDFIDISYLLKTGFEIDMAPYDENNLIFLITDKNSLVDGIPLNFMFANNYKT